MHLNPARVAFCGADDVEIAVAIGIDEDGIFTVARLADRYGLPRGSFGCAAIGKIHARDAALLPAGDQIHCAVAVGISGTNAVRAERRGIDRVPRPRLRALSDWRARQTYADSNSKKS